MAKSGGGTGRGGGGGGGALTIENYRQKMTDNFGPAVAAADRRYEAVRGTEEERRLAVAISQRKNDLGNTRALLREVDRRESLHPSWAHRANSIDLAGTIRRLTGNTPSGFGDARQILLARLNRLWREPI